MCCEICKIGVAVGSTKTTCQSTPLFHDHQWGDVYQSCCSKANTAKVKPISTETKKNYLAVTGQLNYIFIVKFVFKLI